MYVLVLCHCEILLFKILLWSHVQVLDTCKEYCWHKMMVVMLELTTLHMHIVVYNSMCTHIRYIYVCVYMV